MLTVCSQQCDQCLFSKNRIVSERRKKEIMAECRRSDSHFVCHKTKDAVCAGFYQSHSTNLIRIMARLGGIKLVD
jgi:hypothetical protein